MRHNLASCRRVLVHLQNCRSRLQSSLPTRSSGFSRPFPALALARRWARCALQPDQRIDVGHEGLQVFRRDVVHTLQAAQDEVLGVHGAGVLGRLRESLRELLLGAEAGPGVLKAGD